MSTRLAIYVIPLTIFAACSGAKTPTAPTLTPPPVTTVSPPVTPTPPVTPPTTPTITSFAGSWRGAYVIEQCSGQGSIEDVLCSAPSGSRPGGLYPVGTALQLALSLTQNGSVVSGTIAFGEVTGLVTGTVTSDQRLVLRGRATATNGLSLDITAWDTRLSGAQLVGTIAYTAEVRGFPGFGTMTSRLSGVQR